MISLLLFVCTCVLGAGGGIRLGLRVGVESVAEMFTTDLEPGPCNIVGAGPLPFSTKDRSPAR